MANWYPNQVDAFQQEKKGKSVLAYVQSSFYGFNYKP